MALKQPNNPFDPSRPEALIIAENQVEDKPSGDRLPPLAGSLLYLLSGITGAAIGWIIFFLIAAAITIIAVALNSSLIAIISIFLLALAIPAIIVYSAGGILAWLIERLGYLSLGKWQAYTVFVTNWLFYNIVAGVIICLSLLMGAMFNSASFGLVVATVMLLLVILSHLIIPGKTINWLRKMSSTAGKVISICAVAFLGMGVAVFIGGAVLAAVADSEENNRVQVNRSEQQRQARSRLEAATLSSKNFLAADLNRITLANSLCKAGYQIQGVEKNCQFSTVQEMPLERIAADKSKSNKGIWLGQVNSNSSELCIVGGKRIFCTIATADTIQKGWSAFSFLAARQGARDNLGWPSQSLNQSQADFEKTINDLLDQVGQ